MLKLFIYRFDDVVVLDAWLYAVSQTVCATSNGKSSGFIPNYIVWHRFSPKIIHLQNCGALKHRKFFARLFLIEVEV